MAVPKETKNPDARVFELAAYGSEENAISPEPAETPVATAELLIAWMCSCAKAALVIRREDGLCAKQKDQSAWLTALGSIEALRARKTEVAKLVARGFSADIGIAIESARVVDWFTSKKYRLVSSSKLVSHADAKLLRPSFSEERLRLFLALDCLTVVISSHDMDSVYVVQLAR